MKACLSPKIKYPVIEKPFTTLKDFIYQYKCKQEIFYLKERHLNTDTNLPNKNFPSNNFIIDVFLFVIAIVLVLVTNLAMYLLCKHKKLRMLLTSLAFQQIKELGAVPKQEDITTACSCKIQFFIILALSVSILGLVTFAVLYSQKLKLCRGCMFSDTVEFMIFISYV